MPERYMVTLQGVPLKMNLNRTEAQAMAERWQGSYANHRGLLKHKDRGDWVEVRRDYQSEQSFDNAYDCFKRRVEQIPGDRRR